MQRYFSNKKIDNTFLLEKEDYYHIKTVMRFHDGEKIQVVYNNEAYLCSLSNVKEVPIISILETLPKSEEKNIEIVLLLPLLKEQKMDFVLQKATELGISKIIPMATERSIIKLKDEKIDRKIERWTKICKEASEQSYRTTIPEITEIMTYQTMPEWDGIKIVCSTSEQKMKLCSSLQDLDKCARIVIAVGPEGGLTDKEEVLLKSKGFTSVTLGNRIMRVETVPIFLLSIINYELMR